MHYLNFFRKVIMRKKNIKLKTFKFFIVGKISARVPNFPSFLGRPGRRESEYWPTEYVG